MACRQGVDLSRWQSKDGQLWFSEIRAGHVLNDLIAFYRFFIKHENKSVQPCPHLNEVVVFCYYFPLTVALQQSLKKRGGSTHSRSGHIELSVDFLSEMIGLPPDPSREYSFGVFYMKRNEMVPIPLHRYELPGIPDHQPRMKHTAKVQECLSALRDAEADGAN